MVLARRLLLSGGQTPPAPPAKQVKAATAPRKVTALEPAPAPPKRAAAAKVCPPHAAPPTAGPPPTAAAARLAAPRATAAGTASAAFSKVGSAQKGLGTSRATAQRKPVSQQPPGLPSRPAATAGANSQAGSKGDALPKRQKCTAAATEAGGPQRQPPRLSDIEVAGDDEELDEEFDEDELKSRASFLQMQGSKSVEEVAASAGLLLPLRTYS